MLKAILSAAYLWRMTANACAIALAVVFSAPHPLAAQPVSSQVEPIVFGQSYRFHSAVLDDERTLNIYLPSDYASGDRRFSVLYLIDGGLDQDFLQIAGTSQLGALWARSRDVIVIGIATRDRRRELVGPTRNSALLAQYPTAGHSADFRRYIRDEVKPFVEAHFRTDGEDGVIGESLAGLFIAETYLREPGLFDGYAAISPSLWWDDAALSREVATLAGPSQDGKRLYFASANEGADMQANVDRFIGALGQGPDWCYSRGDDLTHATIYHAVSPTALQFLFPTDTPPDPQSGFEISCSKKS